ncbi:unnamed protein product [Knipowitschia caucasica]|uniref:B-cell receptor CD22 n=1 Tax=Knipowitschia caucasica TaxID=637954 RepID=A0AAV2MBU8_KNICA
METHVTQIFWIAHVFFFTGTLAGDWSVDVPVHICAGVGSSVVLPCSYNFPESKNGQQFEARSEMWCLGDGRCITPRYVYHSANILIESLFQNRVEYLGKLGSKNCSLKISSLQGSDSGTYVFYLITTHTTEKMPAQRGVTLHVLDSPSFISMLVDRSSVIMEGQSVTLTCCSAQPSEELLWFKTSSVEPIHSGSEWTIRKTSKEDTGRYYCQVQTKDQVQKSKELVLDVQYPPRNTAITGLAPESTTAGHSVNLTCSSEASPPVRTYYWFTDAACDSGADTSLYKSLQSSGSVNAEGLSIGRISVNFEPSQVHCCVAQNPHGSQKSPTDRSSSGSGGRMVLIGVTIAVLLATIAIIAILLKRRKKSSRNQSYSLAPTTSTGA